MGRGRSVPPFIELMPLVSGLTFFPCPLLRCYGLTMAGPSSFVPWMKAGIGSTLTRILADTRAEIEEDRGRESLKRMKQRVRDAAPVISFASALAQGKALIAELKER